MMAAELVGGALVGTAVAVLYESLKKLIVENLSDGSILEETISRLDSYQPLIEQLIKVHSDEELKGLLDVIDQGKALVRAYLVHGEVTKEKDAEKFCKWDDRVKRQLELIVVRSQIDSRKAAVNTGEMLTLLRELHTCSLLEKQNQRAEDEAYCAVPELPTVTVGLDGPLNKLSRMIFKEGKSMIVVNAMGGSGKTTLAVKFCRDPKVQEMFKNNIFFFTVSEKFNLELIVKQLHQRKGLEVPPSFTNKEDAVTWLQRFLRKEEHYPFLLVLDDVWPESESLVGKFLSKEMKDNKILVTSRSQLLRFGSQDSQYKLEALNVHDAMLLFNHSVNSSHHPELSKMIVDSCKGLPLALTFVGGSLSGQPIDIWRIRSYANRPTIAPKDEVSYSLQRSLEVLDENIKEYFLDLGAFPDHRRIPVGALIDMWAELYDLSPDSDRLVYEELEDAQCNASLINLNIRNLANVVDTRKDKIDEDGYRKGDYVILHDLLKELAIQNSGEGPVEQRTRLIVEIRGNNIPRWKGKSLQARLVSISTDSEFSKKLPDMKLTEAEVLILNFQTRKYMLPELVVNMPELRVLLVKYDVPSDPSFAELDNFKLVGSLPNLKRITLERLSMQSITKNFFLTESLLKMSLILCDLGRAFSNGNCVNISDAFPNLEELIIDRCYNCDEVLAECCDLVHLTKLSIVNCHGLQLLPERIGNLVNLEVLRVRSCKDLLKLPDSVASLKRLKFLDISECSSIDISECSSMCEMSSLKKLDLRYCQDTDELRKSVLKIKQLKEVICTCSYSTQKLWEHVKPSLGSIRILLKFHKVYRFGGSNCGLESANFFLTSDPVHQAWNAIEKLKEINQNAGPCLFNEIQAENPTIIAFGAPHSVLTGQEGLVSSSSLKDESNFDHFEFLCNKTNPMFLLNQAAIELFRSQYHELLQLKNKLVKNSNGETPPLVIITGNSVGGSVATLFTLWLLRDFNECRTKRLLCITFGSPLVGDENLRQCVLRFLTWKSCFLHVVSDQDPTPERFVSLHPYAYKPFGMFLLCSASGCACFEDPVIILDQLMKTNSHNLACHYGQILAHLRCKALCNVSRSTEPYIASLQPRLITRLQASLIAQLEAIGIPLCQDADNLIHHLTKCELE